MEAARLASAAQGVAALRSTFLVSTDSSLRTQRFAQSANPRIAPLTASASLHDAGRTPFNRGPRVPPPSTATSATPSSTSHFATSPAASATNARSPTAPYELPAEFSAEVTSRVIAVGSRAEYDRLMAEAAAGGSDGGEMVVVEVTLAALPNTAANYPKLLALARANPRSRFLRVFVGRSDDLRGIGESLGVAQVPAYAIFRAGRMVHSDIGMDAGRLQQQLDYYSRSDALLSPAAAAAAVSSPATTPTTDTEEVAGGSIEEIDSRDGFDAFLRASEGDDALRVVMATLAFCGPCVRIHPTVAQLAQRQAGAAVFARVFGDANDETRALMRELQVVEAPTFLFYRWGQCVGRYVGSARGALVGEVLKHQGVRVD